VRQPDVVFIHPPSVFDFRDRTIFYGPISDVIPSSPVFEMYPVGFLTMAAYHATFHTIATFAWDNDGSCELSSFSC